MFFLRTKKLENQRFFNICSLLEVTPQIIATIPWWVLSNTQPTQKMATKKTQSKANTAKKKPPVKGKAGATAGKASPKRRSPGKNPAKVVAKTPAGNDDITSIQKTAYFLAEKDNFQGDPTSYWLEAQKQHEAA